MGAPPAWAGSLEAPGMHLARDGGKRILDGFFPSPKIWKKKKTHQPIGFFPKMRGKIKILGKNKFKKKWGDGTNYTKTRDMGFLVGFFFSNIRENWDFWQELDKMPVKSKNRQL